MTPMTIDGRFMGESISIDDIKQLVENTRRVMSSDNKVDNAIVMLGRFCIDLDSRLSGIERKQESLSDSLDRLSDRLTQETDNLSSEIRRARNDNDNLEREVNSLTSDVRQLERHR